MLRSNPERKKNNKTHLILAILLLSFYSEILYAQEAKWPLPFLFREYGRYCFIPDDINLNDTLLYTHSSSTYFKIVPYNSKGKCYMEVYKKNRLYESGHYENSLDTFITFIRPVRMLSKGPVKITRIQYFEPVKDGVWIETHKGKMVHRKYLNGKIVSD